jgi:hypothetical protein
VNGAVYLSIAPTTSDARLKTNITSFVDPLGMVSELRGVYYKWKDPSWDVSSGRLERNDASNETAKSDPLRFVGFLAQDVQRVLPEVVADNSSEDGLLGVKYTELVALLIDAVKVLDQRTSTDKCALQLAPASVASALSERQYEDALLRKYFHFDPITGLVQGVRPHSGDCGCGESDLYDLLEIIRRIEALEREETELLARLDKVVSR